jgi:phosphoglycerol transferase MdoB-like AlkP superfamily enzyme
MVRIIKKNRLGLIVILPALALCISFVTRVALFTKSFNELAITFTTLVEIIGIGLFFDIVNALYFTLPLLLYCWLLPDSLFRTTWNRLFLFSYYALSIFILFFNATGEWFFWDEFNTRYNFIAVDYLVYTNEVAGNIRESYPIEWILLALVMLTVLLMYALRTMVHVQVYETSSFRTRTPLAVGWLAAVYICFAFVTTKQHHVSDNAFVNELAGNGMYELFAAYRNNESSYSQFYAQVSKSLALQSVRAQLLSHNATYLDAGPFSIHRKIVNPGSEKKLNVVLVSIESFNASFMRHFGNAKNMTPFLDSLANNSLLFTNVYATGTRTVRGLEALSLCVPPTPGQSIVRRPNNENLFTLATVFNAKGYESKFVYGGYSYFDNMGYFFSNNGYKVVDRSALKDEEIDYENIWGVADENLFTLAIREIDKTVDTGKPAFVHIMTTSNHRPYTYPEGRIDIPSHTSRAGAIKYTDFAMKRFIRLASKKKWFDNTLFVITADHCASTAGKTQLPIEKYHIPVVMFSPKHINIGIQDRLMSQIDIGPTVLGYLNFSYESKFFGEDINSLRPGLERAFVSTYQLLGFLKKDTLVILSPSKEATVYKVAVGGNLVRVFHSNPLPIAIDAICWYESASYLFSNGLLKE